MTLSVFLSVFQIPELRRKLALTAVLLAVYKMGSWIPLPIVDQLALQDRLDAQKSGGAIGDILNVVSMFSASRAGNVTVFGLGIMPYISASIIFQILGQVYPPLEALQKEGESGRRKINEYTRYAALVICLVQSFIWLRLVAAGSLLGGQVIYSEYASWPYLAVAACTMTAGTGVLMWIGEQIDAFGIGNGISLLIMAGIVGQIPTAVGELVAPAIRTGVRIGTDSGIDRLLLLSILFGLVVALVILANQCVRKIEIQSTRGQIRGRAGAGGVLPLKLNQAGVMPVIFASSLLMFPTLLFSWLGSTFNVALFEAIGASFGVSGVFYNICFIILVYFFAYFWTAVTFSPEEIAKYLKESGSFVPGYRPGKRTVVFLERVVVRVTFIGATFLCFISLVPLAISGGMAISGGVAAIFGGTSLLIVVSVVLDLIQKVDSYLVSRNEAGIIDRRE